MTKFTVTTPSKGKLRCNSCQKAVSPKEGDWFITPDAQAQIFLCKLCEDKSKQKYKRASTTRH